MIFALLRENTLWGPAELQNKQNNHGNLICDSWPVIYAFLCKQKQNKYSRQIGSLYRTPNVLIFSNARKWIDFAVLQIPILTH